MKKRLVPLILALVLCIGLISPASAMITRGSFFYQTEYISMEDWNKTIQPLTGLTMFAVESSVMMEDFGSMPVTYYGLKNSAGNIVFEAEYSGFGYLPENSRIIARKLWFESGGWSRVYSTGVVTTTGEVVYPFTRNIWNIVRTDKTADPDQWTDTIIIEVMDGNPGSTATMGSEQQGLFDYDFNVLVPMEYSGITYLEDGYYSLYLSNKNQEATYGVYKRGSGITIPAEYTQIRYLGSDLFMVRRSDMYCGVLNGKGEQVLPFVFADVTDYKDGFYVAALFRDNASYQALKKQGLFSNGSAALFEHQGNITAMGQDLGGNAPVYEGWGYDLSNTPSYAVWGVIDENQAVCTPFTYEKVYFTGTNVRLGAWNGEHSPQDPFNGMIANFEGGILAKKYNYVSLPFLALIDEGQTVNDLIRLSGLSIPGTTPSVPTTNGGSTVSNWAVGNINNAETAGLVPDWLTGTDLTKSITRADFASVALRLYLAMGGSAKTQQVDNPFTDVDESLNSYGDILLVKALGIVSGQGDGRFDPNGTLTREMAAVMLCNVYKALGHSIPEVSATNFADNGAFSSWARSAVAFMNQNDIVRGKGDNQFDPQGLNAAEEALTMALNMLDKLK